MSQNNIDRIVVPVPTEQERVKMAALLRKELPFEQFACVDIEVRPNLEAA